MEDRRPTWGRSTGSSTQMRVMSSTDACRSKESVLYEISQLHSLVSGELRNRDVKEFISYHGEQLFRGTNQISQNPPVHLNLRNSAVLVSLDQDQIIIVANHAKQFFQGVVTLHLLDESYSAGRTNHHSIAAGPGQTPTVLTRLVQVKVPHAMLDYRYPTAPPLHLGDERL